MSEQEIQSIGRSGCYVSDHHVAAGKIAVIEGNVQDCELWIAASHAEQVNSSHFSEGVSWTVYM